MESNAFPLDKSIRYKPIFYPICETELETIEATMDWCLPPEFRLFLLAVNGLEFLTLTGRPFEGGGPEEVSVIDRVYGFAPAIIEADIRAMQDSHFLREWLPDGEFHCFAQGPSTQFLFDRKGYVYEFYLQTVPPDNEEDRILNVPNYLEETLLTFEEFISSLKAIAY